jgi:hypothetical protein
MYAEGNPVMLIDPNGMNTIRSDAEMFKESLDAFINNGSSQNNPDYSYTRQDIHDAFNQSFNEIVVTPLNEQEQLSQESIANDYLGLYLEGDENSKLPGAIAATMAVASAYVNDEELEAFHNGIWLGNETWTLFETDDPNIPDGPMENRHIFPAIIHQTQERKVVKSSSGKETVIQENEYLIITFEIVLIPYI